MILDKNEGIYIRDTKTGKVRLLMGECYMLKAHEVLWDMEVLFLLSLIPTLVESFSRIAIIQIFELRPRWKEIEIQGSYLSMSMYNSNYYLSIFSQQCCLGLQLFQANN